MAQLCRIEYLHGHCREPEFAVHFQMVFYPNTIVGSCNGIFVCWVYSAIHDLMDRAM